MHRFKRAELYALTIILVKIPSRTVARANFVLLTYLYPIIEIRESIVIQDFCFRLIWKFLRFCVYSTILGIAQFFNSSIARPNKSTKTRTCQCTLFTKVFTINNYNPIQNPPCTDPLNRWMGIALKQAEQHRLSFFFVLARQKRTLQRTKRKFRLPKQ